MRMANPPARRSKPPAPPRCLPLSGGSPPMIELSALQQNSGRAIGRPMLKQGSEASMTKSRLLGGLPMAAIAFGVATVAGLACLSPAGAADKVVKVGITLPLTGADAEDATLIKNGALMAIEEANA